MIKRFLSYVEIKTKITSLFAFLLTLAYLFNIGQKINWLPTMVFFAGMFLFDLATTTINNYIDTKTNHQTLQFKRGIALAVILTLLTISMALGIYLVVLTDVVVLLLGGLCFLVGIFYTFGPVPISRLPLGEVLSGVFYGFFIPLILMYINMPAGTFLAFGFSLKELTLDLSFNIKPWLEVMLLSVAPVFTTTNIMLANNICDLEKDVIVKRHTLPYYIGVKPALRLFAWTYYSIYPVTIIMVVSGMLHPFALVSLLTFFIVHRNVRIFFKKQEKETTFLVAIQNYVIIMGANTLVIFISGFFKG